MLVNVSALEDYMSQVAFTEAQLASATNVLAGVQRQLERYLNRQLDPTLIQERVQSDEDGYLQFSKTPVIQLIAITDQFGGSIAVNQSSSGHPAVNALTPDEKSTYGATSQVDFVGNTFYEQSINGYGGWGGRQTWFGPRVIPGAWYAVKYVASTADPDLSDVFLGILRVSAREMVRQHDDTLTLKDGVFRDDNNPQITGIVGFGFTQTELEQFDRLRRRVIV